MSTSPFTMASSTETSAFATDSLAVFHDKIRASVGVFMRTMSLLFQWNHPLISSPPEGLISIALLAAPVTTLIYSEVGARIFMTVWAMILTAIVVFGPALIDQWSHRFQMRRIATEFDFAKMVNLKAIADLANKHLVYAPMWSIEMWRFSALCPSPDPATRYRINHKPLSQLFWEKVEIHSPFLTQRT